MTQAIKEVMFQFSDKLLNHTSKNDIDNHYNLIIECYTEISNTNLAYELLANDLDDGIIGASN